MPFRMLDYTCALMKQHLAQGHKKIPCIEGLVIYSGGKSPYPAPTEILECFDHPALAKQIMFGSKLGLVDLNQIQERVLAQHDDADILELLLRQGSKGTFVEWLRAHPDVLEKLFARSYKNGGIFYMFIVEREYEPKEILDLIDEIAPDKKEAFMTAAQQLMQEGRLEGRLEGRQEGVQLTRESVVKNMLSDGMEPTRIAKLASLSLEEVEKIAQQASNWPHQDLFPNKA